MRGQRFLSPEDAIDLFQNHVLEVSKSDWKKCFDKWFERMQNHKSDKYSHFHYEARNISSNPRNYGIAALASRADDSLHKEVEEIAV